MNNESKEKEKDHYARLSKVNHNLKSPYLLTIPAFFIDFATAETYHVPRYVCIYVYPRHDFSIIKLHTYMYVCTGPPTLPLLE